MLALALVVSSIAIADSINPSTVLPALYLASSPRARGLASFTVGVFAVYLAGGLVLVLGPGPDLIAALHGIGPQLEHASEAAAGVVLLALAVVMWRRRRNPSAPSERTHRARSRSATFALGAGISAVELPTAFVYFGAVSAIIGSHSAAAVQVSLVVAYNVLFVAPLVAILGVRLLARDRAERRLVAAGAWLRRSAPVALAGVALCAGAALLSVGVSGSLGAA
jgi:threonine/homoserine/homoserine lactone efflux protein